MSAYFSSQAAVTTKINPEIVAAITAAISAYMSAQKNNWHITSIQPTPKYSRRWALKGRHELMTSRFTPEERKCMAV